MYDFSYQKPGSIDDAVKILEGDPEAKALAGGMTYIPVLKQRLAKPTVVVVLPGLESEKKVEKKDRGWYPRG